MSNPRAPRAPLGAKKPIPPPVKSQVKKPAPPPVRPQSTANRKPIPPAVKPQNTANRAAASKPAAPRPAAPKPAAQAPSAPSTASSVASAAPKAGNWINRTVQGAVAGVGNYAASYVYNAGGAVNKIGEGVGKSISDTTRYWGQGVAGYGNNMKDAVGVGGKRVSTAGNPLGIAGMGSSQGALPGGKPAQGAVSSAGRSSASNPLGV